MSVGETPQPAATDAHSMAGMGQSGRDEAMTWCENNGRDYMTAKSEPPLEATGSTSRRVRDNVISS